MEIGALNRDIYRQMNDFTLSFHVIEELKGVIMCFGQYF